LASTDGVAGVGGSIFKLCARRVQCENRSVYNEIRVLRRDCRAGCTHAKFAIRPLFVRRTNNVQPITWPVNFRGRTGSGGPIIGGFLRQKRAFEIFRAGAAIGTSIA
jgi:hypothetical protein